MTDTYYHFLSSLRQGLAAAIERPATGKRADVRLRLQAARRSLSSGEWDGGVPPFDRTVQLYGPGDVVAFDERIVVRTEPKPNSGAFEPNYFPAIEFADPDFVWRFSPEPAEAGGSSLPAEAVALTPWITLVVLVAEDRGEVAREFEELKRSRKRPAIRVASQRHLPNLAHSWRWAHVQATTGSAALDGPALEQLMKADPDLVISRLICPRRLRPSTLYWALLVPTYKLGWAAALNTPEALESARAGKATDLAWDHGSDEPIDLPYFYKWEFRTSVRGDFESLVRLLEPRRLTGLGLREIDCERPGFGLTVERADVEGEQRHRLEMEGALQSLDTEYTRWGKDKNGPAIPGQPPPAVPEPEAFQERLAASVLNRANAIQPHVGLPANFDGTAVLGHLRCQILRDGKSVLFSWGTANDSTGVLQYGPEDDAGGYAYTGFGISDHAARDHAVLVELVPERTYHFRLVVTRAGVSTTTGDATIRVPLPAVVPPIYGRWHRARAGVSASKDHNEWLDVLNLDPRHRAGAGLGSAVVKKQQEALMASAWDQLGAIEAANEELRRAQLGRETSILLHDRLRALALEDFLRLTSPAQRRIARAQIAGERRTVTAELATTALPAAALAPAFRRIARPRGPVRRRQQARATDLIRRILSGELRAAGPHPTLAGTLRPCTITRRTFQQFVFDAWQDQNGGGGGVDVPIVIGDGDGTGLEDLGSGSVTEPDLPHDLPVAPELIPVPESAQRFCDDRIGCAQVDQALTAGVEGVADSAQVAPAVCDALDHFLAPPTPNDGGDTRTRGTAYVETLRDDVHVALDPRVTILGRTRRRLRLDGPLAGRFDPGGSADPLDEILAYPEFPQPMYEPLRDVSEALILPGVEKIPQNTIGLLETNGRFVESYMVGLNHELAGELLWRRYPTDQRGSYFRQFWNVDEYVGKEHVDPALSEVDASGKLKPEVVEALKDIKPLHAWGSSRLGDNDNRAAAKGESLVLVIRGDLLKRYPNALIYAVDSQPDTLLPRLAEFGDGGGTPIFPIFRGSLGADLVFLGFPFTEASARSLKNQAGEYTQTGKFFVLEERVSEPRFGLDSADASLPAPNEPIPWDSLHWGHFQLAELDRAGGFLGEQPISIESPSGEIWNEATSSALRARITLQKAMRLAVHADQMLPPA